MLRTRLLLLNLLWGIGALVSTTILSSYSLPAGVTPSLAANLEEAPAGDDLTVQDKDDLAVQDKTESKPKEPPKPPARPQTPPSSPSRPAPRPTTPPAPTPPRPEPQFNPFVNQQPNQSYLARLSRAPDMFGDSFLPLTATIQSGVSVTAKKSVLDLPLAGGSRRFKNEHSRAMPTDRVFGTYHHFQNALEADGLTPGFESANANVDRFTLGIERTIAEGNASIELRLPLSVPVSLTTLDSMYRTDTVGDLVVTLKGLLDPTSHKPSLSGWRSTLPLETT